jgi:histidyl-tRNA synthetase
MFTNFGAAEAAVSMKMLKELRNAGVRAEIYPDASKMKKQMGYADALAIPFVAIVGETEMAQNKMMLKNMTTGEQALVDVTEAIEIIKK